MDDLISNGHALLLGGSETTATLLSGITYLLLTNQSALKQLSREVRSSFKDEDEITITSVGTLTYMVACLNEAMRIYPPVATGLPRKVPKGGALIGDAFVPEDVSGLFFVLLSLSTTTFSKQKLDMANTVDHRRNVSLGPLPFGDQFCIAL